MAPPGPNASVSLPESAVMVTLLVDYLRNAQWVDTPVSRRHKKHRFPKSVALTLLALWPLLATIAWGRALHLHAVWGFPIVSIYCSFLAGLRLQRIWREPRHFRELATYVYPTGRSTRT